LEGLQWNRHVDLFIVQHLHVLDDGEEDVKFIRVYSSKEAAQQAVDRLRLQPGFCDAPDGFSIDQYPPNEDNWIEGYVTVRHAAEEELEKTEKREEGISSYKPDFI